MHIRLLFFPVGGGKGYTSYKKNVRNRKQNINEDDTNKMFYYVRTDRHCMFPSDQTMNSFFKPAKKVNIEVYLQNFATFFFFSKNDDGNIDNVSKLWSGPLERLLNMLAGIFVLKIKTVLWGLVRYLSFDGW